MCTYLVSVGSVAYGPFDPVIIKIFTFHSQARLTGSIAYDQICEYVGKKASLREAVILIEMTTAKPHIHYVSQHSKWRDGAPLT